jgi:hypothetical protein
MTENEDLERIVAEISRKEELRTRTFFASQNEDHSYQGVLVNNKIVRFHIIPEPRRTPRIPLASTARFLDFVLDFDVSHWSDAADPELKEKYKPVRAAFLVEGDKIHADDKVEINYSRKLRVNHVNYACEQRGVDMKNRDTDEDIPLVYYPFGFETHTSAYTRSGKPLPEVVGVSINEKIQAALKS